MPLTCFSLVFQPRVDCAADVWSQLFSFVRFRGDNSCKMGYQDEPLLSFGLSRTYIMVCQANKLLTRLDWRFSKLFIIFVLAEWSLSYITQYDEVYCQYIPNSLTVSYSTAFRSCFAQSESTHRRLKNHLLLENGQQASIKRVED